MSYVACSFAGLVLFAISLIGIYDLPSRPAEALTVLLEPTGFGSFFDMVYLWSLMFLGIWLVLFVFVRIASGLALVLVLFKILVTNGWLALAVTISLCVLLNMVRHIAPTNQTGHQR